MEATLNIVKIRTSKVKNACTVTRRVANKESAGRNKSTTKKMKRKKNDVAEEIYQDELIFGGDALT